MKKIILSAVLLMLCSSPLFAYDWEYVDVYDDEGNHYTAVEEDWGAWKEIHIQDEEFSGLGRVQNMDSYGGSQKRLQGDDSRSFRKNTEKWLHRGSRD